MGGNFRTESDSMGEVTLPASSYWGAQAQRAAENFAISPYRIPVAMLRALGRIKREAAATNAALGLIDAKIADAVIGAAGELMDGRFDDQFPVDVFQTGSGTSWNMNANEVIANRANEILGAGKGTRSPVHPNDHVNKGQSSNDVIPTATSIACRIEADAFIGALETLRSALDGKAREFRDVIKLGRTHLQDAVPMTLGQEFSGYAEQVRKGADRIRSVYPRLEELPLGGTATGTGLNAHPRFGEETISRIAAASGIPFRPCDNRFEGIAARDSQVELMGAINTVSVSLMKIAQDLRLLASGPRAAIGEISLPSLQPGSSIMPGKVNPVIPEMVIQVAAHVMGKHLAVTIAGQNAPFELNIMQPLIAFETLTSMDLVSHAARTLAERCIAGIEADPERCRSLIDWSLALVTPLALEIGYDEAAKIAYRAYREKRKVRELVIEEGILSEAEADRVLDPGSMLG